MRELLHQLRADETGFVISAELVVVSAVGVLSMIVGLEAVSSAVNQELNDLKSAFGAIKQSFNYRSVQKSGHARVSGAGFDDRADFCDYCLVLPTDVMGQSFPVHVFGGGPGLSPTTSLVDGDVVIKRPYAIEQRTISNDVEGEIIEERIIRQRPFQK